MQAIFRTTLRNVLPSIPSLRPWPFPVPHRPGTHAPWNSDYSPRKKFRKRKKKFSCKYCKKTGDNVPAFPRRKDLYWHIVVCHPKEDQERLEAIRKMRRAKSGKSLHTLAEKVLDDEFGGVQRLPRLSVLSREVEMMLFNGHYSMLNKRCFPSPLLSDLPVGGLVVALLVKIGQREGEFEECQILAEVQTDGKAIEITSDYKLEVAAGQILKNKVGGLLSAPAVWHLAEKFGFNLGGIQVTVKAGKVLKAIITDFSSIMSAECQYVSTGPGGQEEDKTILLSKHSWMNNCFKEDSLEVTLKGLLSIGKVMATPYGLVGPKQLGLKNIQSVSLLKANPEDTIGELTTASNIGAISGNTGTCLVTLPEIAVIVTGQFGKFPHLADYEDENPASVMTATTGAEYWDSDKPTATRLCNGQKLFIEKPEFLLLLVEMAHLKC